MTTLDKNATIEVPVYLIMAMAGPCLADWNMGPENLKKLQEIKDYNEANPQAGKFIDEMADDFEEKGDDAICTEIIGLVKKCLGMP